MNKSMYEDEKVKLNELTSNGNIIDNTEIQNEYNTQIKELSFTKDKVSFAKAFYDFSKENNLESSCQYFSEQVLKLFNEYDFSKPSVCKEIIKDNNLLDTLSELNLIEKLDNKKLQSMYEDMVREKTLQNVEGMTYDVNKENILRNIRKAYERTTGKSLDNKINKPELIDSIKKSDYVKTSSIDISDEAHNHSNSWFDEEQQKAQKEAEEAQKRFEDLNKTKEEKNEKVVADASASVGMTSDAFKKVLEKNDVDYSKIDSYVNEDGVALQNPTGAVITAPITTTEKIKRNIQNRIMMNNLNIEIDNDLETKLVTAIITKKVSAKTEIFQKIAKCKKSIIDGIKKGIDNIKTKAMGKMVDVLEDNGYEFNKPKEAEPEAVKHVNNTTVIGSLNENDIMPPKPSISEDEKDKIADDEINDLLSKMDLNVNSMTQNKKEPEIEVENKVNNNDSLKQIKANIAVKNCLDNLLTADQETSVKLMDDAYTMIGMIEDVKQRRTILSNFTMDYNKLLMQKMNMKDTKPKNSNLEKKVMRLLDKYNSVENSELVDEIYSTINQITNEERRNRLLASANEKINGVIRTNMQKVEEKGRTM